MTKYILPLLLISSPLIADTCRLYVMDLQTEKTVLEVKTKAQFKVNENEIVWSIGSDDKRVCDINIRSGEFEGDKNNDCYYDKSNESFTTVKDNVLVNISECVK